MATLTTVASTSNIPTRIGVVRRGALLIHRATPARNLTDDPHRRGRTATDRAAEAIEAAERVFADEMGGTLGLSPAAKTTLMKTITAAIQAAVDEEKQQLTGAVMFALF